MKSAPFIHHAPATTEEAVDLLRRLGGQDGRILAGGQSLVPIMAFRMARPAHLIDINGLDELDFLVSEGERLRIGARVRHAAFHRPVLEGPLGRVLATVVRYIAHYPIRLRGTFCGSIAHADPASEWCVVAAALGAEIVACGSRGSRIITAESFLQGIMTTSLAEDELLTEVRLPLPEADLRFGFNEFSRRVGDYALACALVTFRLVDDRIAAPRIALGGAEAFPRRIAEAERVLEGEFPSDSVFRAAAEACAAAIDPLEDIHADATYRRDLVRAVTRRALERADA